MYLTNESNTIEVRIRKTPNGKIKIQTITSESEDVKPEINSYLIGKDTLPELLESLNYFQMLTEEPEIMFNDIINEEKDNGPILVLKKK